MTTMPSAYKEVEMSTEIMSASPHRIIQMLFDRCLQQIHQAKHYVEKNDIINRNKCIVAACAIVSHLRDCLHFDDQTKQMAELLNKNYVLVEKSLLNAMLKNDADYLNMAAIIITNIKSGWDQIANK